MNFSDLSRRAPVVYTPCVPSTNTLLKSLAVTSDLPDGYVLVTERQTAGRGRLGRSFESPDGGLYLSLLLYPTRTAEEIPTLTPCAAVAVCRAVKRVCGVSPDIKWPNDLQVDGKKLCGILTESSTVRGKRFVVLGVGINVNTDIAGFPPELRETAGSLSAVTGKRVDAERLARAVIEELDRMSEHWTLDSRYCLEEYRQSCCTLGCDITLLRGDERTDAIALAVGDDFSLIVETGGETKHISFGEVSIRKKAYNKPAAELY